MVIGRVSSPEHEICIGAVFPASDSLASRGIAKSQNRVCKSYRSIGLRGGFSYILAVTEFSLILCVCFRALLSVSVLRRTPALPSLGNCLFTIATKFRTPFARLSAAHVPHFGERLPTPVASFFEIVSRSAEQLPALCLGELHWQFTETCTVMPPRRRVALALLATPFRTHLRSANFSSGSNSYLEI